MAFMPRRFGIRGVVITYAPSNSGLAEFARSQIRSVVAHVHELNEQCIVSINSAMRLWVCERRTLTLILVPGEGGMPEPLIEVIPIFRASYVSPDSAEQELESALDMTGPGHSCLLVRTGLSEAPPSVSALIFGKEQKESIGAKIDGNAKHVEATLYLAATQSGSALVWHSDLIQGKLGYFVTGAANHRNVWRVRRAEADFANRLVFTLQPLNLPNGLPTVDFSAMTDPVLRTEAEQHWREFTEVYLRGLPYRTVNAAKDVCDCVLTDRLMSAGHLNIRKRDFNAALDCLAGVLDKERKLDRKSVTFEDLDYHLLSKIRILHGCTHPDRVAKRGRLDAELALSVLPDVVQVLRASGLVRKVA